MDLSARYHALNERPVLTGPVICWLSRDQRVQDNWALLSAQDLALKNRQPVVAVFCLAASFLGATARHYDFMLAGLKELESDLAKLDIRLLIVFGEASVEIPKLCQELRAGALFSDFSPLRLARRWKQGVAAKIKCAFYEVDVHNIVPVWLASPKQEFGAYTLRPKLHKLLPEYLHEFPKLKKHPFVFSQKRAKNNYAQLRNLLRVDEGVVLVPGIIPGERAAQAALKSFVKSRLSNYNSGRNNPNFNAQSGLSPYLHFGHLSAQRVALAVMKSSAPIQDREAFLEELIVRRELADNFCWYNTHYDSPEGFPAWAKKSISKHARDKRTYLYTKKVLENASTHDSLWNAAQQEMLITGKMHGYMRMYWAKKILEWTPDVATAMKMAIYLNDKYSLDGRDPNGYAGIAWSLGGVHDRAWFERPIFGQIRYMNDKGCRRKFDVEAYIQKFT